MKKILLLFIQFLICINIYSQGSRDSLVSVLKLWSIVDEYNVILGGKPVCYYVKFSSDTIINTINYYRVLRTYDKDKQNWNKIGFIREDSSGVYFMSNEMEEGLIYNFNVNINDTVKINNPILNYENTIEAIVKSVTDTIIGSKTKRKITLSNQSSTEVWIEGIGSFNGIIHSGLKLTEITGTDPSLLCYFDNESLEYSNPKYDSCFCSSTANISTVAENDLFNIFPNPFKNELYLKLNSHTDLSHYIVRLYNIEGKEMSIQQIHKTDSHCQLQIGNIQQGNYILTITNGRNTYYQKVTKH